MKHPKYITQLSAKDIESMMRAGNIKPGYGVLIEQTDDGLIVSLDQKAVAQIIWNYIANATATVNTVALKDVVNLKLQTV